MRRFVIIDSDDRSCYGTFMIHIPSIALAGLVRTPLLHTRKIEALVNLSCQQRSRTLLRK